MLTLKAEIEEIKSTYATQDSVDKLKSSILRLQNDPLPPPASAFKINSKTGAFLDSGPMGLSHDYTVNNINDTTGLISPMSELRDVRVTQDKQTGVSCNAGPECSPSLPQLCRKASASVTVTSDLPSSATEVVNQLTATDKAGFVCVKGHSQSEQPIIVRETLTNENNKKEGWQTVTYHKKPRNYSYVGKLV
ncbi:unnamed protein product [Parnassius apollo]|uniref:(apollo) hypothetical protein n=1 Tax=Parnassius apollo TaxID=110799 RepID=A0A8S3X0F9_PARAO|nr:unnamed protein product [Parnassius apollo]